MNCNGEFSLAMVKQSHMEFVVTGECIYALEDFTCAPILPRKTRPVVIIGWVIVCLFVLAYGFAVNLDQWATESDVDRAIKVFEWASMFGVGLGLNWLARKWRRRQRRVRRFRRWFEANKASRWNVTLSSAGVTYVCESRRRHWSWHRYFGYVENAQGFYLLIGHGRMEVIPKRAIAEQSWENVRELLRRHACAAKGFPVTVEGEVEQPIVPGDQQGGKGNTQA